MANFNKAERYVNVDGEYKLLSYATSSESVEMTDGTDLQTKMDSVDKNISNETTRAKGAESTLTTNLNSEISRAQSAEQSNATAISNETTRAKGAENNLDSKKSNIASPTFTGTPKAPTAPYGTNTTQIATTAFVQTAVSEGIAASDALIFKGTLGTSGTITALPTTYKTGWTYRVITAGAYAGQVCEVGDLVIALVDRNGSGNLNSDWCVAQTNIDGAITGIKSGDAYIEISQSGSVVTIKHKDVTRTNTTSTASPSHGGTFTAVKSVTSDAKGHVTGVDTETVTLPTQYSHPSYTARTGAPTANQTPTFGGTFSVTQPVSDATGHITAMNSRTVTIPNAVATQSAAGLESAADKKKLDGIATGAEVNQNAFSKVVVGSTTVSADSKTDTLTLVAGSNVTITPDATNDKITIAATDTNTVTTATTTGSGNAVTAITASNGALTVTKGATFLTAHPTISTSTDSTSTASPSAGGTFTAVDSVTRDSNGHVTKINTKTITLPNTAVAVDSSLSSTSTNPVQNKVINSALAKKSSVSFSASLTSGTKVGTLTINGTGTDLYCQTNTDTHYTSHLYVGASGGNSNATSTTSNPYLLCVDNTTNRNSIQLKAGTNMGISAVNGVVTFNNTYSLPTASSSTLGGIKVGTNLTISSGVLSSTQRSVSSTYTSTITNASTTAFSQEGAYNMYTALNESLIDFVYPIGSIYISVNSTSPATLFGGTWVAITAGYYLKSITSGTGGTYTNATNVGSTTLTVNQIPGHTHSISNNNYQAGDSGGGGNWGYAINNAGGGNVTGNALVAKSTGGGQSHTHSMGTPATMTVYMWKRTA